MKTPVIAVVGATGAVGEEILLCLDQLKVPHQEIKLLASARSAGKTLPFQGKDLVIQELTEDAFASVDIALFSVGSDIVKTFAPLAAETGAIVIDNSSAYRMDDDVPLVIPEINGEDAKNVPRNIIANPNCTTIVTLMALNPMHQAFGGCETLIASSYQAVSGSGAQGIAELEDQVKAYAEDQPIEVNLYPRQIAFNVIPQVEPITENGYTKEEMKMQNETRKILHAPNIRASATCVRVPVLRSHVFLPPLSLQVSPMSKRRAKQSKKPQVSNLSTTGTFLATPLHLTLPMVTTAWSAESARISPSTTA